MAKAYTGITKYLIKAEFEISGVVDKPDIIGAIFGQSEGLLGQELDLNELQKSGKVGRIEVQSTINMGSTKGTVEVPTSMDMVETSILAAAVESVEKVGPCDSKFKVLSIDDTRTEKRKEIASRAKDLLKRFIKEQAPDTTELAKQVRETTRASDVKEVGFDKVSIGVSAIASPEILVVEGRADVLQLAKNNITNTVGMNGSKITKTLLDICANKQVTVFVDGDRGGILNARKLANLLKIDFVAQAPDGKEVEELTSKEVHLALKRKKSLQDFMQEQKIPFRQALGSRSFSSKLSRNFELNQDSGSGSNSKFERNFERPFERRNNFSRNNFGRNNFDRNNSERNNFSRNNFDRNNFGRREFSRSYSRDNYQRDNYSRENNFSRNQSSFNRNSFDSQPGFQKNNYLERIPRPDSPAIQESVSAASEFKPVIKSPIASVLNKFKANEAESTRFKPLMEPLKGTLKALFVDEKNKKIAEVPIRDLVSSLEKKRKKINAIVFDGIITQRVLDAALAKKVSFLVGIKANEIQPNDKIRIIEIQ